ncbi:MAG: hypothetical protein JST16_00690 [Bdellovibrionales bacterium]|nr:hypothetical protein [Bdellovibrionales bacterium]
MTTDDVQEPVRLADEGDGRYRTLLKRGVKLPLGVAPCIDANGAAVLISSHRISMQQPDEFVLPEVAAKQHLPWDLRSFMRLDDKGYHIASARLQTMRLGGALISDNLRRTIEWIHGGCQGPGPPSTYTYTAAELKGLSKEELKELCRAHDLPLTASNSGQLTNRLLNSHLCAKPSTDLPDVNRDIITLPFLLTPDLLHPRVRNIIPNIRKRTKQLTDIYSTFWDEVAVWLHDLHNRERLTAILTSVDTARAAPRKQARAKREKEWAAREKERQRQRDGLADSDSRVGDDDSDGDDENTDSEDAPGAKRRKPTAVECDHDETWLQEVLKSILHQLAGVRCVKPSADGHLPTPLYNEADGFHDMKDLLQVILRQVLTTELPVFVKNVVSEARKMIVAMIPATNGALRARVASDTRPGEVDPARLEAYPEYLATLVHETQLLADEVDDHCRFLRAMRLGIMFQAERERQADCDPFLPEFKLLPKGSLSRRHAEIGHACADQLLRHYGYMELVGTGLAGLFNWQAPKFAGILHHPRGGQPLLGRPTTVTTDGYWVHFRFERLVRAWTPSATGRPTPRVYNNHYAISKIRQRRKAMTTVDELHRWRLRRYKPDNQGEQVDEEKLKWTGVVDGEALAADIERLLATRDSTLAKQREWAGQLKKLLTCEDGCVGADPGLHPIVALSNGYVVERKFVYQQRREQWPKQIQLLVKELSKKSVNVFSMNALRAAVAARRQLIPLATEFFGSGKRCRRRGFMANGKQSVRDRVTAGLLQKRDDEGKAIGKDMYNVVFFGSGFSGGSVKSLRKQLGSRALVVMSERLLLNWPPYKYRFISSCSSLSTAPEYFTSQRCSCAEGRASGTVWRVTAPGSKWQICNQCGVKRNRDAVSAENILFLGLHLFKTGQRHELFQEQADVTAKRVTRIAVDDEDSEDEFSDVESMYDDSDDDSSDSGRLDDDEDDNEDNNDSNNEDEDEVDGEGGKEERKLANDGE